MGYMRADSEAGGLKAVPGAEVSPSGPAEVKDTRSDTLSPTAAKAGQPSV